MQKRVAAAGIEHYCTKMEPGSDGGSSYVQKVLARWVRDDGKRLRLKKVNSGGGKRRKHDNQELRRRLDDAWLR